MKGKNNTSRSTKEERNRQRKVQRKRANVERQDEKITQKRKNQNG